MMERTLPYLPETHFNEDIEVKNTGTLFDRIFHNIAPIIIEFIGTLLLVFVIELATTPHGPMPINPPLTIGFGLMVIVFWGGHISGGHYNPAVTFGVLLTMRQKVGIISALCYVIAQVAGGFVGALIALGVLGRIGTGPVVGDGYHIGQALSVEFLWTFVLVSVILNVATTKSHSNNSFYGLAIGGTVFVGAAIAGNISGGAFNPAVGTGPKIVWYFFQNATDSGKKPFDLDLWIYWIGPLSASIVSALIFRLTNIPEYTEIEEEGFERLTERATSVNSDFF